MRVFGSDKADNITIDGVTVDFISTGTGDDEITLKNGAKITNDINTGDGKDTISIDGEGTIVKGDIFTNDGADTITMTNKSTVDGNINTGDGDDVINMDGEAKVGASIYGRDGDDYITLDNKSILGKKIKVMGDDGKEREVAVSGNIEAGKGAGEIKILGGSLIEKEIRSGIEREIVEKGDTQDNHNFAGNVKVTIKDSVVNQSLDLNGLGDREITLDNSTVHGTIYAGHYSDSKITVKDSKVGFKIIGEGGKDTIIVDNSTIGANPKFKDESSSVVLGDGGGFNDGDDTIEIKNNSIIQGGVEGGGGKDTITVSGKSTVVKDKVSGGEGDDTINVEEGANVYYEKITPVYKDVYTGPKPDNLLPEPDLPDIYSDEEYEEFSKKGMKYGSTTTKFGKNFLKPILIKTT
ncbi:hypothetical protein [Campylobacter sp. RM16190]|uniref:hypothetical protein n=1 Tax=Campylobacter sp. RM16190 TaxID=1705727 RepID=UPI001475A683|nr:hypothetical protein [Campylobacter sp. RM16190]